LEKMREAGIFAKAFMRGLPVVRRQELSAIHIFSSKAADGIEGQTGL
jgi:hypothetical protein